MPRIFVGDLHDAPAVQLLGVRTNVPGVHSALAVLWVKGFRKASLVDLSTARNPRFGAAYGGPETMERYLSILEVSHASLNLG